MHIGLITGEYPPLQGGVGAYTDILSRRFVAHGHQVSVFSNTKTQAQSPDIPLNNTVTRWNYRTNRRINTWARSNHIDILNLQFQTAAFDMSAWVHVLPQMTQTPFVTTFHDLRFPYLFPKAGFLRDWIVMHLAKQSDYAIVTNHEDLQRVQHLPATLIPIGSNITETAPVDTAHWRQKMQIQTDEFIIAHFGFINHTKGLETLLAAIASLKNPKIKLLMIGGRTGTADPTNAAYAESIDTRIQQLALSQQVIWTGFVEEHEVSAYLQTADIVTLPFRDGASFRRGSLMAAIQQSCAIISTYPTVPIPEFTPENMSLVPPDDVVALAQAIQALLQSPQKRQQLRTNIQKLHPRFDWDIITSETLAIFEKVLQGKNT